MPNRVVRAVAVFLGACIVASLLVVATVGVSHAGEDTTLCRSTGERVAIPNDFVIDACFDGTNLVLRNRKELVLRVSRSGSPQQGVLRPVGGVPTVAAGLIEAAHSSSDPDLLPPNYELRIPVVGAGAGAVEVFGVKTYQQQYVLTKGLITAFGLGGPLTGAAQSVVNLNQSLISTWSTFQNCAKTARGYFGRVGCDANYTREVAVALVRFTASLVGKVAIKKARFSVDGIRNILDTADWVNAAVGDFSAFVKGERKLTIAAAGPGTEDPESPPVGGEVGRAPVLSAASGPAGRSVSFRVDGCPAVPPGKAERLDVDVIGPDGRPHGSRATYGMEPDGSVPESPNGIPYFYTFAAGDSHQDAPPGDYRITVRCYLYNPENDYDGQTVKTFATVPFRVTGPSPTIRVSSPTAKTGDVIRATPTASCPTGSVTPVGYANIYKTNGPGEAYDYLVADTPKMQQDGSWTQDFHVQEGAAPGRYIVRGACPHQNAQTPGQDYGAVEGSLTIEPTQVAGAAARSAPPSTASRAAPAPASAAAADTAPKAAAPRSTPRVPRPSLTQTTTPSTSTTKRSAPQP